MKEMRIKRKVTTEKIRMIKEDKREKKGWNRKGAE